MSKRVITEKRMGRDMCMTRRPCAARGQQGLTWSTLTAPLPLTFTLCPGPRVSRWFCKRTQRHSLTPGPLHLLFSLGGPSALTHLPVTSPPSLLIGHLLGSLSPISPLKHQPAHPTHPLTHTPLHCLSSYLLPPSNKLMI